MILILKNQEFAVQPFHGEDDGAVVRPIHGTVSTSDYAKVYATISSGVLVIVPKQPAPEGASYDVTITVHAFDENAAPLVDASIYVTVNGPLAPPPPPPGATHVVFGTTQIVSPITGNPDVASDPGTDTVSFSF